MYQDFIIPELETRRQTFIQSVDDAVGDDYQKSDALTSFAANALRSVEHGASEFQCELWVRAIHNVAKSPPLNWPSLLSVLDSAFLDQTHLTLLRLFDNPHDTHQNFAIPQPANDGLLQIFHRLINSMRLTPEEQIEIRLHWSRLVELGLAWMPSDVVMHVSGLARYTTDLGADFVRLVMANDPPLRPIVRSTTRQREKIQTPLKWQAEKQPEKYDLSW